VFYFAVWCFPDSNWLRDLAGAILFLSLWFLIPLLGFGIGWLKGFPRWVYPYVAFSVLISLYLMNASTPGIVLFGVPIFGREPWGIYACLPGLLMAAVVLALTRSFRSLLVFFENGWKDWTRFTYALFGLMPLVNWIAFDEIRDSYELPFQTVLILIMVLAAAAYLRSTRKTSAAISVRRVWPVRADRYHRTYPVLAWRMPSLCSRDGDHCVHLHAHRLPAGVDRFDPPFHQIRKQWNIVIYSLWICFHSTSQ
jgi:hypothetical protein